MKPKRANRPTVQDVVRRWQVRHDEGPDYGLTPPDFATRGEACYRRDEWNKECPGHYVKMIEVPATSFAARALPHER